MTLENMSVMSYNFEMEIPNAGFFSPFDHFNREVEARNEGNISRL